MNEKKKELTYKDAGVDIEAGGKVVELIKERTQHTFRHFPGKILSGLGGFNAPVELPDGNIMLTSTDGVGTKLMLAILMNINNTVGIDLVAMCVNDLLVGGVMPNFFLDYLSMGKVVPEKAESIIGGIIDGCEIAQCALIGGETAEMPGLYEPDEYDLAGFTIGFANSKEKLILGNDIKTGMNVYGVHSSGLHSNGYSLVRKIFDISLENPDSSRKNLETYYDAFGCILGEELLKPTKIYVSKIKCLLSKYKISGMVNITGGGLIENPPRVLPDGCGMEINLGSWWTPPIFPLIQKLGNVSDKEMRKTFNNGLGFLVITPEEIQGPELEEISKIGKIIRNRTKEVYFT